MTRAESADSLEVRASAGGFRWWIAGMLFLATVISYVDRGLISFLKPDLQRDLKLDEIGYGNIVAAFSLAYALGQLISGRIMDVIGVRLGFALTVVIWSIAAALHAAAGTAFSFESARFALGLAEGGNYPGATKACAIWFEKKERALAAGIFNAGSNVGAIVTPILVVTLTVHLKLNWRIAYIAMGVAGIAWVGPWMFMARRKPEVAEPPGEKISWIGLFNHRITWAFTLGIMLTSPIWWFYLYWLPDFLNKAFGLSKEQAQWPVIVVYMISAVGSLAGGGISSALIHRGRSVNFGRKIGLLICAACVLPVYFAPRAGGIWPSTLLIALAAAAHQGWASNLYTLVSDELPAAAVSSVVGIGGMVAGLMAMAFQHFTGHLLQARSAGAYPILFFICAAAYPVALTCVQILVPRVDCERKRSTFLIPSPGTPGEG